MTLNAGTLVAYDFINNSTGSVTMSTSGSFSGFLTIGDNFTNYSSSTGSITLSGGDVQFYGSITSGSSTIDATTGTVEFDGTVGQTIPNNAFVNNTINNLTISNQSTTGVSLGGTGTLTITGTLTPSQNSGEGILNTGGNLILASTATGTGTGTAIIAPSSCSGYINGNVRVDRFIPAKSQREWEMLSSPIVAVAPPPGSPSLTLTSTSIFNNWQQQMYVSGSSSTGPGTGNGTDCGSYTASPGSSTSAYNDNYFDETYTEDPSMETYSNTTSNFVSIPNTSTSLQPGLGYRVNVRGGRTTNGACSTQLVTAYTNPPDAVTLSTLGGLYTGNITVNLPEPNPNTSTYYYNLMGNPYPCQISIDNLYSHNSSTIYDEIWTICPGYFYTSGNYTTYSNGTIAYLPTGTGYTSYTGPGNPYNGFLIASGQGFFVQEKVGCTATSIAFEESDKVPTTAVPSDAFFSVNDNNKLVRVGLRASTNTPLDEVVVRYNSKGAKGYVPGWDAQSLNTGNQIITTLKDKRAFAIATHPDNIASDTAQLGISSTEVGTFSLNFSDLDGMTGTYDIQLRDKYLGVMQDVVANPTYSFNITANTLSKGNNRFELVVTKKGSMATIATEEASAAQKITVYPNPAKDVLTIGGIGVGESYTATIVSVLGKQVSTSLVVGGTSAGLNVKNLAAGVYLLELVDTNGEKQTLRFVKE